ncbi:hypothetical protein GCM10011584_24300 [Nocardioides phosphati]|uniref:DUF4304 domain-containing protein n=1 Tax=Nocardioides phosphati TaxID=1867775 RepID=A0ABQ2NCQ0_9ACTN|nr:hypothetical protein [Nocardioides phosphati]GGO91077.1 hypothetical protein GCM10011584_24300 [Nocardioides phosphati]
MVKRPVEVDLSLPQDVADAKGWLEANGYRLTEAETTLGTWASHLVFEGPFRVYVEVERGYWNLHAGRSAADSHQLQLLMPACRGVAWTDLFPDSGLNGAGVQPEGFRWAEELPPVLAWLAETDAATVSEQVGQVKAEMLAQHDRESAERHRRWKRRNGR